MAFVPPLPRSGTTQPAIVIEDLCKSYNGVQVLNSVSLAIARGDFATILGPSGSGKTTVLRCLAGLEDPDSGRIWMNDRLVFDAARGVNAPTRRRQLGMIFQNYALWPHMTVLQHVTFPLLRQGNKSPVEAARVALRSVGLHQHEDRFPHQLSGGQQQRVAVARAIVSGPEVLLMDEPLSNLDVQLRLQLRDELKAAHVNANATSVFVTHDQGEAFALSDYLVLMRDGDIIQDGAPETVRNNPASGFVAEFLGFENILAGQALARILRRDGGAPLGLDDSASYAINAARLTSSPARDQDNMRCIENCELVSHSFDGTIHASSFLSDGTTLVVKSLEKASIPNGPSRLWVHDQDIIRINAN